MLLPAVVGQYSENILNWEMSHFVTPHNRIDHTTAALAPQPALTLVSEPSLTLITPALSWETISEWLLVTVKTPWTCCQSWIQPIEKWKFPIVDAKWCKFPMEIADQSWIQPYKEKWKAVGHQQAGGKRLRNSFRATQRHAPHAMLSLQYKLNAKRLRCAETAQPASVPGTVTLSTGFLTQIAFSARETQAINSNCQAKRARLRKAHLHHFFLNSNFSTYAFYQLSLSFQLPLPLETIMGH